jgi:hypothetical protein
MERKFNDWLKEFINWASFTEAPIHTLFWTGVATLAGAVRRRVWLDMRAFQWTPNFYIILVAPPGIVSKSTTINVGLNLLREVPGIVFGPDSVTWQALVTAFSEAQESAHFPARDEYLPMSCVTIGSDEFGNFLNPDDKQMVNLLISLWDGKRGTFSKITKTSGNDHIENPWINMIACTTPGWIADNFGDNMIGGGFTSRCIFVYADRKRQLVALPDEVAPPDYEERRSLLIHDLELISQLIGEMKIDEKARAWMRAWYAKHWESLPPELNNDQFGGYLARKQTHIVKLAMILSVAKSNSLVIIEDDFAAAEGIISDLEAGMPQVYQRIGQTEITRGSLSLVEIVRKHGKISRTDLYKHLFRTLSYRDFEIALISAINAGHIRQIQQGSDFILEYNRK